MDGELAWYKARSGLTAGTLSDQKQAFWESQIIGNGGGGGGSTTPAVRTGYITTAPNVSQTTIVLDPSIPTGGGAIAVGDWMIAVVHINVPSAATYTPPTPPSGAAWTELMPSWGTIGTQFTKVYAKQRVATETTYTFTANAATFQNGVLLWVRGGDVIANWVLGLGKARTDTPASSTVNMAKTLNVVTAQSLVLGFSFERTTVTEAAITSVTGATEWFFAPQVGSSIVTTDVAYVDNAGVGATAEIDTTYPNAQATNGWAFQLAIPPSAGAAPVPVGQEDKAVSNVSQVFSLQPIELSHHGSELDFVENSKAAFEGSALYNRHLILEFPLYDTTDGVQVLSEDTTLTRLFGNASTITTVTWASISGLTTTVGAQPIARMEDICEDPALLNRVIMIDARHQTSTQVTAVLNYMDLHGGVNRFIAKFNGTTNFWAQQARARGYKTYGYFAHSDVGVALDANAQYCDIIAMDTTTGTAAADFAAALAKGKPTVAHILSTKAQRTTADGLGANGYMISSVKTILNDYAPGGGTLSGGTQSDNSSQFYALTGTAGITSGNEFQYWASLSGLTPAAAYTLTDHKRATILKG